MIYKRPTIVESPSLPKNIEAFNKAKNVHTKMAIFFDENFYSDNRNDELCYQYMYHIFYMLASTKHYFMKFEDYDSYAQFASNMIYARFLRKWKKNLRITSVLNYAKSCCGHIKVSWQNKHFRDVTNVNDKKSVQKSIAIETFVNNYVSDSISNNVSYISDINATYKEISKIINDILDESPYKSNLLIRRKIYISCVITLLKSFTLCNANKEKFNNRNTSNANPEVLHNVLVRMYAHEIENSVTLWNLDNSMSNYIKFVVNKTKSILTKNISEIKSYYTLPDNEIEMIVNSAWENTKHTNYKEDIDL